MIRKQLYLEEAQDKALRARARELGISEAEFVRRALNTALQPPGSLTALPQTALARFLDNAKHVSEAHHFPEGYSFDRDELYEEREDRWLKRP